VPCTSHADQWDRVIDSVEQNHPSYVAELMRSDELEKVIEQRVQSCLWCLVRAQELLPKHDRSVHDEMRCQALEDVNRIERMRRR
jgi:hypothetical protein